MQDVIDGQVSYHVSLASFEVVDLPFGKLRVGVLEVVLADGSITAKRALSNASITVSHC